MWINGSGVNGSGKAGLLTYAAMKTHHAAALALIGW
jgi:ABC-type molybdenum transport system ATPase subunit/photorepair protein PhrA